MDEDLHRGASAGLAAMLATQMEQAASAGEDGPSLDLLVEGAITDHRVGGASRNDLRMKLRALRQWTSWRLRRTGPKRLLGRYDAPSLD